MNTQSKLRLNEQNLHQLPSTISVPNYDRKNVQAGIVHVGVGGFHRSHEAYYTDEYMNQTGDLNWGICGVGLRDADRKMKSILEQQDYLYTLIVKHPNGTIENQVIGCMTDFLLGCDEPNAVIQKMADASTKIVSLTITEGGYNFNPATNEFDFDNPDVIHDLANPHTPRLVFGFLTAALKLRMERGLAPFTVQSCDNIQHNGDVARKMLLAYSQKVDLELAKWIEQEVPFPNAMVDRITPVTTSADIDYLSSELSLQDEWPVTCEPFHQWIIEDKFSVGRPQWQKVGAQFVPDVTPYENMKIRLLNAGHSVLGILGSIHGFETIDESVKDPTFSQFLQLFMDTEVTPILPPVDGIDLDDYKQTLLQRFANPNIKDHLTRICSESASKLATFLIPTINDNLQNKGNIECATLVLAAWCYYSDKQTNRHNKEITIIDVMSQDLHIAAAKYSLNPDAFLQLTSIFGDLNKNQDFLDIYRKQTKQIYSDANIKKHMQCIVDNATLAVS
ncbi:mannitol dehydrogenase family protein [Aliiglaciecola sp. 3_MG-2023]|uniref:mannitol dehydrogenase family protein n=1 Tax=Aliiglaciecola sp. 3_MG-2023 TaxID=3062644 RepID=UPI0026E1C847|nr:mannitol dehydrogenase family protein [Aliiglaciecola sp. 3_MG-2023]MDO6694166.1 mannitol dehydrogenase family protein [Aliiglaciecola sp. 3_MG-2023]